ncbi:MAG: L,D-transpeptidase family protein, partial [Planctomycetes bacterium]|nr:L,D-transpeptidase family protein [Planctomycetota bacterium]
ERVQGGDNLTRIARRVKKASGGNVTSALIMRINGLSSDRIRAGANLAVPTGTMTVRVHKSDFRLFLVMDGEIILDFAVGTGKSDSTPVGDFEIQGKTKNPTWTRPDGSVVPSGHPDHIIGTRWLGFANAQGGTGFGIHGTVDDSSIGKAMSEGCVRMKNREVEELFELVPEGCRVEVRP